MYQFRTFFIGLRSWLQHPLKVLVGCLAVFVFTLFLNGTVWEIIGLRSDSRKIQSQIAEAKFQILELNNKLKLVKNDSFMERTARDKLDYANDKDLIFVFPE